MTIALRADDFAPAPQAWRRQLSMLLGTFALLIGLFARDAADLIRIWWTSTTFGHCLFIGPVVGWLVWQRRRELAALTPVAWAPGLTIVAAGGLAWLAGEAGGVALARHFGLVTMLQGAVVTLLGPQIARGLLFPLLYAYFCVPFGEGLERPLQQVTVAMTLPLLHLAGVPAQVDGVLITIPNGYFEVAEACSGAKFVIAMLAYGVLVANVCYMSWARRAAFLAMALVVPVIANGLRAFGTIYAAHLTSVEAATGFDHIVYGWVFFGIVMAAVLAIGWRWFDRDPDAAWIDVTQLPAPRRGLDPWLATALVVTIAAAFPAWSSLTAGRVDTLPTRVALPEIPGWRHMPPSTRAAWSPNYPGADHFLIGRYADPQGHQVDLAIAVYGAQREGHEVIAFGVGPLREEDRWVRVSALPSIAGGAAMRITAPGPIERIVASWYRVGGTLTASPVAVKLATLRARLLGGRQAAVAVHVSAEEPGGEAAIARFLAALGPVDRVADRSAGIH
ncbi:MULTISPECIES: exosortase A [Sphingomonas]|uniref:exosortase A n=1 Tax=Sphingomonas TaxID=13687 RepID=UPI000829F541|nr:exosortase A [Sphingomonas sp. CCH10-B3]